MSNKIKNQKAGRFVDKGGFGCVYKNPGLKCNTTGQRSPPGTISKLMTKNNAIKELAEYDAIDTIDPGFVFHFGKPKLCSDVAIPDVDNDNQFRDCNFGHPPTNILGPGFSQLKDLAFLEQEDGGLSLRQFIDVKNTEFASISNETMRKRAREVEFLKVFVYLGRVVLGLTDMASHDYYHQDIKLNNIVLKESDTYDKNYNIRLIDWGLASYGSNWKHFSGSFYFVRSPEQAAFSADVLIILRRNYGTDKNAYKRALESFLIEKYNNSYSRTIVRNNINSSGQAFFPKNKNPYLNVLNQLDSIMNVLMRNNPLEIKDIKDKIKRQSDVFSLGIVLIELWKGLLGYPYESDLIDGWHSIKNRYISILREINILIKRMCILDLDQRISPWELRSKHSEISKMIINLVGEVSWGSLGDFLEVDTPSDARVSVEDYPGYDNVAPAAEPIVRTSNCEKFKKTVNPKCEEQLGCKWVVKKGCLPKENEERRADEPAAVVPVPVVNEARDDDYDSIPDIFVPPAPRSANCKKFKKTVNPKCEEQPGCKWVVRKGCLPNENGNRRVVAALPVVPPAAAAVVPPAAPRLYTQKKPAPHGKVFNPLTGNFVKSTGAVAKDLRKRGLI